VVCEVLNAFPYKFTNEKQISFKKNPYVKKSLCEQRLGAKAVRASYPDKTRAYKRLAEKFQLLIIYTKFDSFVLNLLRA